MISYLLSGWRVFVPDANGQPLYRGRVYFYDASTSEPSAVYQEKEKVTSLGTYVDVDNHGFLPPIWLDSSHLYKCVVKRLIQQDPETWETLWEIDDVGNPFITAETDDGSSTIMVNDISLLRAIDVTSDERPDYVSVAGWFNPGDTGSPMVFCWREGEVHNEDGHWVKPGSSASLGTWEQILDDELDPRKFGAIPDTGNAVDSALVNCMRYACEPHIQDISDPTVYKPRTVKFARSGTYHLNGSFDFTQYSMIPAFDSVPVPVVIGDGTYFDNSVYIGKATRIECSKPFASYFELSDANACIRTSWCLNVGPIVNSPARILIIDSDLFESVSVFPINNRLVIDTFNVALDNFEPVLNESILFRVREGKVFFGNGYNFFYNENSDYAFHIKKGADDILKLNSDRTTTFNEWVNLVKGIKFDAYNYIGMVNTDPAVILQDAVLHITARNGSKKDITFDHASIEDVLIDKIASVDTDKDHIVFNSPAYRVYDGEYTWTLSTKHGSGSGYDFGLLGSNFTDNDKFNVVTEWAQNDSSIYLEEFIYLTGAHGKVVGNIICVENCGAFGINTDMLPTDLNMRLFSGTAGNIFILGPRSSSESGYVDKIIDVIPPYTSKKFILRPGGYWDPVEI